MVAGVFQWKNLTTCTPLFIGTICYIIPTIPCCRVNHYFTFLAYFYSALFFTWLWGQHHHHLPAFHLGKLLDNAMLCQVRSYALDQAHADFLVSHFTTTKTQCDFGFVAIIQKLDQVAQLDVVISFIRIWTKLDFLDLDLFLLELGFMQLLAFGIFKFADVHDATHGWIR